MRKNNIYTLIGMVILSVIAFLLNPSFLEFSNIITIIRQASILFLLSSGLTVVILTGNIDLSIGSTAALTGCVCALMMVGGYPILVSALASMLVGILIGCLNGFLVGWMDLPSFLATYGMNMVASGLALMVMRGGVIYDLPSSFNKLGVGFLGPIPIPVIISFSILILFYFVLRRTVFGRNIYMVGYNRTASIYSGTNDRLLLLKAFIISGITASLGGILMTARLNAADAGMSESYGLQIVAAVVLGGTSLLGGEGGVEGTILGAMILTMIINIMNMNQINSNWQNFVLGIIIIVIVGINNLLNKKSRSGS